MAPLRRARKQVGIGNREAESEREEENYEKADIRHHAAQAYGQHADALKVAEELEYTQEDSNDNERIECPCPSVLHAGIREVGRWVGHFRIHVSQVLARGCVPAAEDDDR
eukprot:6116277-Prymnesium_polylepis.1